jgi:hypothetical protein
MAHWRRFLVGAIGAASLVGAGTVSAGADQGDTLLQFDSMTPVTGSAVGTVNDRGLRGGGFPWAISTGTGQVDQGVVEVDVTGLVIPVAPFNGKNPVGKFDAVLSCLTPGGVVNLSTGSFPANAAGDSTIVDTVNVPSQCGSPELFVGATLGNGFVWFARSNAQVENAQ